MYNRYKSIYAEHIKEFVDFKRSLGFKYETEETILALFDRFAITRGKLGITEELAEAWKQCKPNESSSYKVHRCTCLNQFASFLCKQGIPSYILPLPRHKSAFIPYIFSLEQMTAVFKSVDALRVKKKEWTRPYLLCRPLLDYCMQPGCVSVKHYL